MSELPNAFDVITVNLIHAAEMGGTLEETLQDIVRTLKKEMAFSASIRTTMIYPAFVGILFVVIVVMMLAFVVPRISKVFLALRVDMPAMTRFLFEASAYFLENWLFILLGAIVGVTLLSVFVHYNKRAIIRLFLGLPWLKTLGRNIDLARFTRSFALLLKSGLPVDEALELSGRVVQKKRVLKIVEQMRDDVASGQGLATHLREHHNIIPIIMTRSLETAESSGTLEKTMQNLSEYFSEQVEQNLKILSSLMEPIMLVVVGGLVGGLMLTVMAPMYNLISQVQNKDTFQGIQQNK
jgi:type II secretory pathway component PulF